MIVTTKVLLNKNVSKVKFEIVDKGPYSFAFLGCSTVNVPNLKKLTNNVFCTEEEHTLGSFYRPGSSSSENTFCEVHCICKPLNRTLVFIYLVPHRTHQVLKFFLC